MFAALVGYAVGQVEQVVAVVVVQEFAFAFNVSRSVIVLSYALLLLLPLRFTLPLAQFVGV